MIPDPDVPAARPTRWRRLGLGLVLVVLAAPWLARALAPEMAWTAADFALFSLLVLGCAVVCALAARVIQNTRRRILVSVAVIGGALLLAAEGAVGLFH